MALIYPKHYYLYVHGGASLIQSTHAFNSSGYMLLFIAV